MKNTQLLLIFTVTVMVLAALFVTGCDEGMNMVNPVITEPGEEPMTPEGPITTNGDIKQPPEEIPGDNNEDPGEQNPGETETPTSEPTPTVTIDTVVQADDTSVTIAGTSTNVPEGAKVTIVLGDGAITVKAVVDKDGAWSTTVPAKKTVRLSPGIIAVTATARKVTAKSSFEIVPLSEPAPHENDFVGQVVIPTGDQEWASRIHTRPVAGATLTVLSGARTGEQAVTDEDGRYRFSDATGETLQLRLRVEKDGFETRKVIVHRSQPTEVLSDGVVFSLNKSDPQKTPGTILVGHKWPDKVRFILEETLLPHDLILVIVDDLPNYAGLYWEGLVVVQNGNCLLNTVAHELAHAHQHAIAVMEGKPDDSPHQWENTTEGKAYMNAQEKDWEEVGKISYDRGRYLTLPYENMAETANEFWDIRGRFDTRQCFRAINLAEEAPNRLRWAQEWLSKKYE